MFRLTAATLSLIYITCVQVAGNGTVVKPMRNNVDNQMIEFSVGEKKNSDLSFADDNESRVIDVDSEFNYSINSDNSANDSESSRSRSVTLNVGQWAILQCSNDRNTWTCEMERHLIISELGFWDTLRFVVGDEKLKIGFKSKKFDDQSPKPPKLFHLRILLDCPSQCKDSCLSSSLYMHSFWLGLVIGLMVGTILIAMLASCMSASVASAEGEKTKNEHQSSCFSSV